MSVQPQPHEDRWRAPAVVLVALLAVVLIGTGGVALLTGGAPPLPTGPTPPPTTNGSASPSGSSEETDAQGFPLEVLGMPVATVGGALTLIGSGGLNGRALAVAGFWVPGIIPGCPMPRRFMTPLEAYCQWQMFASKGYEAVSCRATSNGGSECRSNQPPSDTQVMSPLSVDWSVGIERLMTAAQQPQWRSTGVPAILIGHAGDPRLWHCPVDTRSECAREFVIDRVAWLAGDWIDLAPDPNRIPSRMAVEEAASAAHVDTDLVAALVVTAKDAPTVDPRLHLTGDETVWILRYQRPGQAAADDPTRAVDVAVVDDSSGAIVASTGLELDDAYRPARLLIQATEPGECCPGFDEYPFYRIARKDGTDIALSSIGGTESGTADNTRTRFYAGLPAVLEPGDYVITAWNATQARDGSSGPAHDQCSVEVTLVALDEQRLEAQFPTDGPCTFVPPTFGDDLF
jgi:hypothetical protein